VVGVKKQITTTKNDKILDWRRILFKI